ncbi:MAG TPA: methionyl-tRNA formyltransferase [Candidatus Paceibacterota bacterium]|nr:methionyl-tRNA formyltransferase [Candidatus Paceibacterota bacterium]
MQHKFAFFGTPDVAKQTLATLIEHGFVPAVVITNPDAPKGRGLTLTPSPVKEWALAHNLPVLTPETLDTEALAGVQAHGCEYAVVVAYGKIFPEMFIDAFLKGVLNVHYSLLPKYRGATPMEAALKNGDAVTGVTVQKMVRELDAGDILAQIELPIAVSETARELRPRLIEAGAKLLVETLPAFERGEIVPIAQDATRVTRAGKFKKEDGKLDVSALGPQNWNTYRAYADTIGTHFFTEKGTRLKITHASLSPSGDFVIERVIPEGKRELPYADFKE